MHSLCFSWKFINFNSMFSFFPPGFMLWLVNANTILAPREIDYLFFYYSKNKKVPHCHEWCVYQNNVKLSQRTQLFRVTQTQLEINGHHVATGKVIAGYQWVKALLDIQTLGRVQLGSSTMHSNTGACQGHCSCKLKCSHILVVYIRAFPMFVCVRSFWIISLMVPHDKDWIYIP